MTREELVAALRESGKLFNLAECYAAAAMLEQDASEFSDISHLAARYLAERDALAAKAARLREALDELIWLVSPHYPSPQVCPELEAARAALKETA